MAKEKNVPAEIPEPEPAAASSAEETFQRIQQAILGGWGKPTPREVGPGHWSVDCPGSSHPTLAIEAASAAEAVEKYRAQLGLGE
jgi:hypothetical protein